MESPAATVHSDLDQATVNHLKGLVIDGVDRAQSGHVGGAMSSMDFAYLLWTEYLHWDPTDPHYMSRDRFVLSAGHESMMLYALLYASDVLPLSELQNFRQLGSQTPGHPEVDITDHVECTTGPLGQGAAMSVGMALAACHLRHALDEELYSYHTWCLLGDGCMQEEVTLGAAALAGHLCLFHLIWFYDCNKVQISGSKERAASECSRKVFEGFGWDVFEVADGHDHGALREVIHRAQQCRRPCLIIAHTVMAKGSHSLEGSCEAHGSVFSPQERQATKARLGIVHEDTDTEQSFCFPPHLKVHFQRNFSSLRKQAHQKRMRLSQLKNQSDFAHLYDGYYHPEKWLSQVQPCEWTDSPIATRKAFGRVLAALAHMPAIMGGSADLEPSNMTGEFARLVGDFTSQNRCGRNLAFGVREFTMGCVCNGMALHGGFYPFCATFLVFSDYMRAAIRLAALQKITVLFEFSHESFYVGEDGPTHQPVEHLMSLRLIPGLYVMRPADGAETQALMRYALSLKAPTALAVSRQSITPLSALISSLPQDYGDQAIQGAWVVYGGDDQDYSHEDEDGSCVIFASGSEVSLAVEVAQLAQDHECVWLHHIRVVSVPCFELFWQQPHEYIEAVLSENKTRRVSIEAGSTLGWERFVGRDGLAIGLDQFSHSAPASCLQEHFGFRPDQVLERIVNHFKKTEDLGS